MISRKAGGSTNRRRRRHESAAHHEAGHAVAAFVLGLKLGRRDVTIVPDKERDMLGYANIAARLRERPDRATSARTKARIEAWAVAHLAGDVAERKFNGRRRLGGHSDLLQASDLLEYISTSVEQFDARLRVAYVGARDLIEDNWVSVQAVAEELLRKKTLSADEVAKLVLPRLLAA
jgi:ATP-dependent Zn protease